MTFLTMTMWLNCGQTSHPTTQSHGERNNPNYAAQHLRENSPCPIVQCQVKSFQIKLKGKKSTTQKDQGHFPLPEATCPIDRTSGHPKGFERQNFHRSLDNRPWLWIFLRFPAAKPKLLILQQLLRIHTLLPASLQKFPSITSRRIASCCWAKKSR